MGGKVSLPDEGLLEIYGRKVEVKMEASYTAIIDLFSSAFLEVFMNKVPQGELIPIGGGDTIPLNRHQLSIGRRRSCDIYLDFPNISSVHCELSYKDGYWFITDKNSTNGTKVNNMRVATRKLLIPGDEIGIAKRRFTIKYSMPSDKRLEDMMDDDILSKPLLERAGLQKGRDEFDDE